jgi:hypothetical protein
MIMEINGIGNNNMNNIYYINELGFSKGNHNFDLHRLPQAYIEYFPWITISWDEIDEIPKNSIIFVQTPCNNETIKLKKLLTIIDHNIVFINQESNIFDWFEWDAQTQQLYIECLSKCKAFCYHNEHDKKVMEIFCSNFIKYPGCTNITVETSKNFNDGQYVMVPNPIKRYQRGMISHKIASDNIKNIPIYSMSYKRPITNELLSFPDEYKLPNIELKSRMGLNEWFEFIYNSKFGIDIHREFSGGNCSLEFGALGVPLIGNINLDTQRDIFPDLSFEYNDYKNIKNVIHLLLNDSDFYNEVSEKSLINTREIYSSKLIVEQFKQDILNIL